MVGENTNHGVCCTVTPVKAENKQAILLISRGLGAKYSVKKRWLNSEILPRFGCSQRRTDKRTI
jgi:hypothetical protein